MAEQDTTKNTAETPQAAATKLELAEKPKESNGGLAVKTETKSEKGEIELSKADYGYLANRPIGPGAIEVGDSFFSAGLRPIAATHMDVFGTILNGRPIMSSNLRVLEFAGPGQRPVFASDVVVRDDLSLPGGRPIIASDESLLHAPLLMGGRPIASNAIDDSETLMGFID
jgi:hypothetical protein